MGDGRWEMVFPVIRRHDQTLEREVKELGRANEILKLASAFFAQAELGRHLKSSMPS